MAFVDMFLDALTSSAVTMAWIFIAFWGIERLWPRGEGPTRTEIWRALNYWTIFAFAVALVAPLLNFFPRPEPLIDVAAAVRSTPRWVQYLFGPFLFWVMYDFFNYWMHRAQHRWLWRQHRVHHSITKLSALNSYFHPTEPIFRTLLIFVPLAIFAGSGMVGGTLAATIIFTAHSYYVHSPIRFNFGPWGRRIMVDNAFHRVHHSIEERHFGKNFGAFTTIWDQMFGTAYFPARDEWPATGVVGTPPPNSIGQFLGMPFRSIREESELSQLAPTQLLTPTVENPVLKGAKSA